MTRLDVIYEGVEEEESNEFSAQPDGHPLMDMCAAATRFFEDLIDSSVRFFANGHGSPPCW